MTKRLAMKEHLLEIARKAILEELYSQKLLDRESILAVNPELKKEGAVFVTLTIDGRLRGCIGSIIPHRPLIDDLIANAKAAAFHDPRFFPLTHKEADKIRIEISLLSLPKMVRYENADDLRAKIRPKIDGVILHYGGYQALFLPQVWEELPDFGLFFAHLCKKAGLGANCLDVHPEIYLFEVEKISEEPK